MASWDRLYGVLPEELPLPVRYFVVGMLVCGGQLGSVVGLESRPLDLADIPGLITPR